MENKGKTVLIKKWESFGLLSNIQDNKKEKLSKLYNRMTNYFLKNDHDGEIVTLMFGAIFRLVKKLPSSHKINFKNVYDNLTEYWKNFNNFKNDNPHIDFEVTYLSQFCDEYIKKKFKLDIIIKLKTKNYGK